MYRLKLTADGSSSLSVADSVVEYFKDMGALNRYRDIALGSDGITIYLLTDSVGGTSGPSAGNDGGVTNRGSILAYKFSGTVLDIGNDPLVASNARLQVKMYPNPVSNVLTIESKRNVAKPIFYQLLDMMGRPVLQGSSTKDKIELNVARLARGI